MRHTAIRCILFCPLIFLLTITMALAQEQQPNSTPATAAIAGATIAEWKGNIRLSLPGQSSSYPQRGEQLPSGTLLDTGSGKLLLRLSDGSQLLVRPHTRLQVQQPSLTDESYFQLLLGRIRAVINKRTGGAVPFELGTPSAVIAVRGTQFEVEVNPRNITEVDVIDGLVEVYGRNPSERSVLVEPGFSTRVGIDTVPEQPEPTEEMRPEVEWPELERPEPREHEHNEQSELHREFELAEVEAPEIESEMNSKTAAMTELQEISEEREKVEVETPEGPGAQ